MKKSLSRLRMRGALSSAIVGVQMEDVAGSGGGIVEGGSSRATWKISTSRHRESSARMSSFLAFVPFENFGVELGEQGKVNLVVADFSCVG